MEDVLLNISPHLGRSMVLLLLLLLLRCCCCCFPVIPLEEEDGGGRYSKEEEESFFCLSLFLRPVDCIRLSVLLLDVGLEALAFGLCFPVFNAAVVVVAVVDDAFPLVLLLFDCNVDCDDVFLLYVVDRLLPPLCRLFR